MNPYTYYTKLNEQKNVQKHQDTMEDDTPTERAAAEGDRISKRWVEEYFGVGHEELNDSFSFWKNWLLKHEPVLSSLEYYGATRRLLLALPCVVSDLEGKDLEWFMNWSDGLR